MPNIKMPDGKVVAFPDSMSKDEIRAAIVKKYPELESGGGTEIGPASSPAGSAAPAQEGSLPTPAPEPENPMAGVVGNTAAFLNNMADTASFGIAPAIQRTVKNFFNPGSGDEAQADIDYANQQNPAGSAAGFIAGIPLGAVATGPLAATIGNTSRIGNAFVQGGGKIGEGLRMAGIGGTTGAIEAGTHGEDVLTGAATGAVLGPIAGVVAKPVIEAAKRVLPGLSRQSDRAWRYLAGKLGADPAQLQLRVEAYRLNTGREPSLQQIVSDHDAGVLAEAGSLLPHAGQELRAGAERAAADAVDAGAQITGRAQATLPNAPPMIAGVRPADATPAVLLNARDDAMDLAMEPLRATAVTIDDDLLDAINEAGVMSTRKFNALHERVNDGTATLGDFDIVRRRLSAMNARGEHSPDIEDVLDDLNDVIATQVPAYRPLLDDYAKASRYADAFRHGLSGAAADDATDAGLRRTLRSAEGTDGYAAGQLSRTQQAATASPSSAERTLRNISEPGAGRQNFTGVAPAAAPRAQRAAAATVEGVERARAAAPGHLRPPADTSGGPQLATAVADVAIGAGISGMRQAMQGASRALKGLNLPPAAQRQIGAALASNNPRDVEMVLAQLRRAGADEQTIRRARLIAAQAFAGKGTETVMQTRNKPAEITVHGGA